MALDVLWSDMLECLKQHLSDDEFDHWLSPLQAIREEKTLVLLAPNKFVRDHVHDHWFEMMNTLIQGMFSDMKIAIRVGSYHEKKDVDAPESASIKETKKGKQTGLNRFMTMNRFIRGKSNELACAAADQVIQNPGASYNPLFIYGHVGLGKTHLAHAIGHEIAKARPSSKITYVRSERYVTHMIQSLRDNTMHEFKEHYRQAHVLLIDDIQFFSGKERSQEELFHIFNDLLEEHRQMIFTCDRYPKEIKGLEERLKSRFGWGLTVAVEPPELETRVAILMSKAEDFQIKLPDEVAFLVAHRIRSNVRELEGALKRIIANAQLTQSAITVPFAKEALRDLFSVQDRLVNMDNIQRAVAEYYKIRVSDLSCSKRRHRTIARPRQVAMSLAKALTSHSLAEIAASFGGRDHTTVMYACKKIKSLYDTDTGLREDYDNLMRLLSV